MKVLMGITGVILLLVILLVINPTRRWVVQALSGGTIKRDSVTTVNPCNCDTVAIREGWIKKKPEPRKHLAYRPHKIEIPTPLPSPQKVQVEVKVSGQVDVRVHGNVSTEGKTERTPSPPPEQKPPEIKKGGAPCDSCQKPKPWRSHFWGKQFDEKNERRNQN